MREKALLVTVDVSRDNRLRDVEWLAAERAYELKQLVLSVGAEVTGEEIVKRRLISPAHFIGKGKAEEIYERCRESSIDVVVFNNDLTGTQQKNLEDIIQVKTVDRTQLILDIFARRAKSNDGKIQVELAQLLYLLPRLTGRGVLLSRLGGGIGTRGPGEQKIEVDRRKIRARITKLKRDLDNIAKHRKTSRKQRMDFSLLTIALVGYTNTGKSTLLNSLTGAHVLAEDRLFSTLDPTIRSYVLPNNQKIIFSDTVGFLNDLPHHLIESFNATLEEVVDADLLIHLIDASHPKCRQQSDAVYRILEELGCAEKPVINVLNKIDKIDEVNHIHRMADEFDNAVPISAVKGIGLDKLLDRIVLYLSKMMTNISIEVPQHNVKVVQFMHEHAHILNKEYKGENVCFEAQIPSRFKAILEKMAAGCHLKSSS